MAGAVFVEYVFSTGKGIGVVIVDALEYYDFPGNYGCGAAHFGDVGTGKHHRGHYLRIPGSKGAPSISKNYQRGSNENRYFYIIIQSDNRFEEVGQCKNFFKAKMNRNMRKRIVAGKLENEPFPGGSPQSGGRGFVTMISKDVNSVEENKPEVVFFPPFVYITDVVKLTNTTPGVSTGAQNCHQEANGAFTGEVSAAMIASCGATHTLVGHSETPFLF
jgi:hypothetical protein